MTREKPRLGRAEAAGSPRYKRTRYWVMPELQGRFAGWLVAVTAVTGAVVTLVILMALWASLADRLVWTGGGDAEALFWQASARIVFTAVILIVVFGLAALLTGIVVSHRVAGPLYRMSNVVDQVSQGQYSDRVTLRERDYLHGFAAKFNEILRYLDEHVEHHSSALNRLHDKVVELDAAASHGDVAPDELSSRLDDILEVVREARYGGPLGQAEQSAG